MDVVVVGGGASGVLAAIKASRNNNVTLVDSNDKTLKKLLLTGNGHCNYWNSDIDYLKYNTDCIDNLKVILEKKDEVLNYLYDLGIYPKIKNGYYYPYSREASSVKEIFDSNLNFDVRYNFKVIDIKKIDNKFYVSSDNDTIICDKVIISTGSKALPKTGCDGSGYILASNFNHSINKVNPSLVPLYASGNYLKDWENIRCDARVSLFVDYKEIASEVGEIQLTKNGISGICVYNISSKAIRNLDKKVNVKINFVPDIVSFDKFLFDRIVKYKDKTIEECLESLFNYKLLFVLLKRCKILKDTKCSLLSKNDIDNLINNITMFDVEIVGSDDYMKSQVCSGGVSLKEINPNTMESNIVSGLYFTGEVLDVDGICGGFNLAFAFITGYIAGDLC